MSSREKGRFINVCYYKRKITSACRSAEQNVDWQNTAEQNVDWPFFVPIRKVSRRLAFCRAFKEGLSFRKVSRRLTFFRAFKEGLSLKRGVINKSQYRVAWLNH